MLRKYCGMPYSVSLLREGGRGLLSNNVSITTPSPHLLYEDIFNPPFYVNTNLFLTLSDDNVIFIFHINVHNNPHVVHLFTV
jgi:hypothetical protein